MSSEISQPDITDRQLIPPGAPARKSLSREIGEAQVVQTLFGRAKVRIIRKEDGLRRSLWWIVLAVMLMAVAVQVWLIWQQQEEVVAGEVAAPVVADAASAPAVVEVLPSDPAPVPPPPVVPQRQPAVVAPVTPPIGVTPAKPPVAAGAIAQNPVRPAPAVPQPVTAAAAPAAPKQVVQPVPKPVAQPIPKPAAATATSAPAATPQNVTATEAEAEVKPAQPAYPQP